MMQLSTRCKHKTCLMERKITFMQWMNAWVINLQMELTMNKIFTLLKEISILIQAQNNVRKNPIVFSNFLKYRHFCSDFNENLMGFDSCGKG